MRPESPPPTGRALLDLDQAWSTRPWAGRQPSRGETLDLEARFTLPADLGSSAATLVIDGLRGDARLQVNKQAFAPRSGGPGPLRFDVGESLVAGTNTMVLAIRAVPPGTDPLLSGSRDRVAWMAGPPRLEFGPAAGLELVSADLDEGRVRVTVRRGSGAGLAQSPARVKVVATRDGEVIQELGEADFHGSLATTSPTSWRGPMWPEDRDPLVMIWAHIEDDTGQIVDSRAVRTGLRDVSLSETSIVLNGEPLVPVAWRKSTRSFPETLSELTRVGANALELHGTSPDSAWLDRTDELGIFVVDLPRCDGQVRADARRLAANDTLLAGQDRARIDMMASHPSHIIWIAEGRSDLVAGRVARYAADPVQRLQVNGDLPGLNGAIGFPPPEVAGPWWNIELNLPHGQRSRSNRVAMVTQVIAAANEHLDAGAVGTVVPAWGVGGSGDEAAWRAALAARNVTPPTAGRRAPARIEISGLDAGQSAWAQASWHPRVGAIADGDGIARLELWHEGAATISVDGVSVDLTVSPGSWDLSGTDGSGASWDALATGWSGTVTETSWPPAG